jgi:hypothetical protein
MNEPPSLTRLAPAVVVDAGELQERAESGAPWTIRSNIVRVRAVFTVDSSKSSPD